MLHVASVCTLCCMLLRKVWNRSNFQPTTPNISFVPWSPKRSATMLDPFAQLFQHCWGHARSLRMAYKDLWVVSFLRCVVGPNIVGSYCIRLHAALSANWIRKKSIMYHGAKTYSELVRTQRLPEMHFHFPFNLTGKLAMDLLTSPSLCVLKSWYAGGGPKQGFQRCFADGLNQRVVLSVAQATFFLI